MKRAIGLVIGLMVLAATAWTVYSAPATAAVDTPKKAGIMAQFGVATNTRIWAGTMVALNSSGYAVPAADASGYTVVGRAAKTVDNRTGQTGAGDNGALTIDVERGVFGWASSTITSDASVGSICFVADDKTVTSSGGSYNIIAGTVVDYSDGKVWVDTFNIGRTAGSFTTLAASGATALSSTLAVTGNTTVGGTLGVTGNSTLSGTLGVTGVATLTAVPRLNAARGTAGSVVLVTSDAPAGTTSNALWVAVNVGGTNCWIAAYPQ
jgi:hypothetical protein